MKLNKMINKNILIIIITLLILILGISLASYALFLKVEETSDEVIEYGDLKINYANNTNFVSRLSDEPKNDAEGSLTNPYTFTITNTGTLKANFSVLIYDDEEYIKHNNLIKTSDIYMKYQIDNNTPDLLSNITNNEIITSSLEPGSSITYNLRFWLIENAPNTVLGSSMVKKIKLKTEYIPENN